MNIIQNCRELREKNRLRASRIEKDPKLREKLIISSRIEKGKDPKLRDKLIISSNTQKDPKLRDKLII